MNTNLGFLSGNPCKEYEWQRNSERNLTLKSRNPTDKQTQDGKSSTALRSDCAVFASLCMGTVWLLRSWSSDGWIYPSSPLRSHTPAFQHWIWLTLSWIMDSLKAATLPLCGTVLPLLICSLSSPRCILGLGKYPTGITLPLTTIKNHLDLVFIQALLCQKNSTSRSSLYNLQMTLKSSFITFLLTNQRPRLDLQSTAKIILNFIYFI